jgi:hypothetical protein
MQMVTGKWVSKALSVSADLAIADLLAGGPLHVDDLAAAAGSNADALYRILRALSAVGVFEELPDKKFQNNAISNLLRSDVPGSMRALVRFIGAAPTWEAWNALGYSAKTGLPAFDHALGQHVFDYLKGHQDAAALFNDAMVSLTEVTSTAVAEGYDFSAFRKIVDVGGGHGALLAKIVQKYPEVRGIVADMPEVVAGAVPFLATQGVDGKVTTVGIDFFESVPPGADAYMMKHIIHDWDDDRAVGILSNCHKVMAPAAKVLVIEQVVADRPDAVFSKLIDLEMLVMTGGGRERTEQEFAALLKRAGLRMTRIVATQSFDAIVEAVAAS